MSVQACPSFPTVSVLLYLVFLTTARRQQETVQCDGRQGSRPISRWVVFVLSFRRGAGPPFPAGFTAGGPCRRPQQVAAEGP
eukprot:12910583-Prorocentrum_lima.AAC.1